MRRSIRLEYSEYLLSQSLLGFFDLISPVVVTVIDIQLEFEMLQVPRRGHEPQERAREIDTVCIGRMLHRVVSIDPFELLVTNEDLVDGRGFEQCASDSAPHDIFARSDSIR